MDQKLSKMFISSPNKAMIRESEAKFFIFYYEIMPKIPGKREKLPTKI